MAEVIAKKEKKNKKAKKVAVEEAAEPAVVEVEAVTEKKVKKSKKSKKSEDAEEAAEVAAEEPKKKKSKKNMEAAVEEEATETPKEADAETDDAEPAAKKAKTESGDENASEEKKDDAEEKKELGYKGDYDKYAPKAEGTTVFVGGLPFEADKETVEKDFAECGEIAIFHMPTHWDTGKLKGIAFVTYKAKEAVTKALAFDGTQYGSKVLRVREADDAPATASGPKGGKGAGKKGDGKGKGSEPREWKRTADEKPEPECKSLIIKNLPFDTTEEQIWAMFKDFTDDNKIEKLNLAKDRDTGRFRGIAFVDFFDTTDAEKALGDKQGADVDGRTIFINWNGFHNKAEKGKGSKGKDGEKGEKGEKGFGKGKGKDGGKGKGKKGDGKKGGKGPSASNMDRTKMDGSIVESTGEAKKFDSDSD